MQICLSLQGQSGLKSRGGIRRKIWQLFLNMNRASNFTERFNRFLYRQHLRKLGPGEIETAREWCHFIIRREHPHLTEEQRDLFYKNLINVKITVVDEWTRRMT
jgi:hypothetical protein